MSVELYELLVEEEGSTKLLHGAYAHAVRGTFWVYSEAGTISLHRGLRLLPSPVGSNLWESGVAYLEEPNRLRSLARRYQRPEGYGEYRLDESEEEVQPPANVFPIRIPPDFEDSSET